MPEFVTDRNQGHVNSLNNLRKKGWDRMSPSERAMWYDTAAKGAYNYTDLNRVESAVAEIAELLGLSLSTKTNWTLWDIPTKSEMVRYLRNVAAIRDAVEPDEPYPTLPDSMSNLNHVTANNLEKVLEIAYRSIPQSAGLGKFILNKSLLA